MVTRTGRHKRERRRDNSSHDTSPARLAALSTTLSLSRPVTHTHTQQSEAAQEAALRAKYGGLLPKKKVGLPVDHRFFDSADWALSKQQAASAAAASTFALRSTSSGVSGKGTRRSARQRPQHWWAAKKSANP